MPHYRKNGFGGSTEENDEWIRDLRRTTETENELRIVRFQVLAAVSVKTSVF
jgi:hypothetical protein